jgi:hypothetical protein
MRRVVVLFFFLCIGILNISAQNKQDLIGWDEKRPLTWKDFKGKPEQDYPFHALTAGSMYYEYERMGDTKFKFKLKMGFDPKKSWVKANEATDKLLVHEQIHFDIYELYARIMIKKIEDSKTLSGKNFSDKMKKVFNDTFEELVKFQRKYDHETDHSKKEDKQKEWNEKIVKMLKEYQKYAYREITFSI